jgi:toxin YhaV
MTSAGADRPLVIKGWSIFAHPQFLDNFELPVAQVERPRAKNPTKRLAAIVKLAFEIIPQDPTRPEYRQGASLGNEYKHWFRAKFFQQYRLFFRYHGESRIIIYAWVNDNGARDRRVTTGSSEDSFPQRSRINGPRPVCAAQSSQRIPSENR